MERTPSSQVEVAALNAAPDFDDFEDDLKDVFWPNFDPLPGETSVAFNLRFTFACAGYRTTKIEEPVTHPVMIVRTVLPDTRRISNQRLLLEHIRDILCRAGFRPKRDELTIGQTGTRLLIAFPNGKTAINFEEILREPQDDLADYADVVL